MKRTWTESDLAYLEANYMTKTHIEIAKDLEKSVTAIKSKCFVRGWVLPPSVVYERRRIAARSANNTRRLSDGEDEFVKTHYMDLTMHEIARRLNRAKSAVKCSMVRQGLALPPEILDARKRLTTGTVSWNKGKKQSDYMTTEQIEKTIATRFKKGDKIHNAHPVGTEVMIRNDNRDYIKVKIAEPKQWKWKHILIWETHFGLVKKGYIVNFKDGNTLNLDIDNLQCMTREAHIRSEGVAGKYDVDIQTLSDDYVADVLKRRTGLDRDDIPSELINLKRAALKVNRQLNDIKKSKQDESE